MIHHSYLRIISTQLELSRLLVRVMPWLRTLRPLLQSAPPSARVTSPRPSAWATRRREGHLAHEALVAREVEAAGVGVEQPVLLPLAQAQVLTVCTHRSHSNQPRGELIACTSRGERWGGVMHGGGGAAPSVPGYLRPPCTPRPPPPPPGAGPCPCRKTTQRSAASGLAAPST